MNDPQQSRNFWIGNGLLAVALIMLIFLGDLWARLGVAAMALWMTIAAAGIYFVMKDKGPSDNMPH